MKRRTAAALLGLLFFAGCQSQREEPKSTASLEPPVHNAVTDYVDRGIGTMNNAQTAADAMNARTAQQNQAVQSEGNP